MQILLSGKLKSLFNVSGCSHQTSDDMQMMAVGFGYQSDQTCFVNVPLPPGNSLLCLKDLPAEFFRSLDKCFTAEREILYRHRLDVLEPCELSWEEHDSGRFRYISFELPVGEYRFGPIGMFFPIPKEGTLWLPQMCDQSQRSYVVSSSDNKPVGQWTKSQHQLAIHVQSEHVGEMLDMSEHVWRHANNPPAIVEFQRTKPRQRN